MKNLRRNTDPETSHEAAEFIEPFLNELQTQALDMVRAYPDRTQAEIDELAGNGRAHILGKRFAELERAGMIESKHTRRCTVGKRNARTYRVKDMQSGAKIVQRGLFPDATGIRDDRIR